MTTQPTAEEVKALIARTIYDAQWIEDALALLRRLAAVPPIPETMQGPRPYTRVEAAPQHPPAPLSVPSDDAATMKEMARHSLSLQDALWHCYEAIYGHRKADNIDPFETVARAIPEIVKQRDELKAEVEHLRPDAELARRALKLIEHATAPGADDAYHENAHSIARQALSDLKWGTTDAALREPAQERK